MKTACNTLHTARDPIKDPRARAHLEAVALLGDVPHLRDELLLAALRAVPGPATQMHGMAGELCRKVSCNYTLCSV